MRWLMWLIGGVLLGGIVHLATVLWLPRTATQDAYSRLVPVTQVNTVTALPDATPEKTLLPYMDPAFATAICRYDLSEGPMQLSLTVSQAYTAVSFYTRYGRAYYSINDRAAGRRSIQLDLMTEQQHNDMPEEEDVTAADRLIVESPTTTGVIVMKALAPEPGLMPMAHDALATGRCRPAPAN